MNIKKAEKTDLPEILDLQYLAYQSEAKLFENEYQRGTGLFISEN